MWQETAPTITGKRPSISPEDCTPKSVATQRSIQIWTICAGDVRRRMIKLMAPVVGVVLLGGSCAVCGQCGWEDLFWICRPENSRAINEVV